MKKKVIAIDGPAGAGKSTVAQVIAQRLQYTYIDTGAMYRAIAWKVLQKKVAITDTASIADIAQHIRIQLVYVDGKTTVLVDDYDVTASIRDPEISRMVPEVAQVAAVRTALTALQRSMAEEGGVVMDGRDIGTHVLPNADIKIFLTASIEERARRRFAELTEKGFSVDLAKLTTEIADRDKKDCEREIAPLIQASDAILVDSTTFHIEQTVDTILKLCREREDLV